MHQSKDSIIKYVKSKKEVSIPDIQLKYDLDYKTVVKIFDELVESKTIYLYDGITYKLSEICETDSLSDDSLSSARAMLERRRQEILSRMQLDLDDVDESDDEDDEDVYQRDDLMSNRDRNLGRVLMSLSRGIGYRLLENEAVLRIDLGYPDDSRYRLSIKQADEFCYLTDNKLTLNYLNANIDVEEEYVKESIESILSQYNIKQENGELRCYIGEASEPIISICFFITAIENLVNLISNNIVYATISKTTIECIELTKKILVENEKCSRVEIIEKLNNYLKAYRENNDKDNIIVYEQLIKGFKSLTDEAFDNIKEEYVEYDEE